MPIKAIRFQQKAIYIIICAIVTTVFNAIRRKYNRVFVDYIVLFICNELFFQYSNYK